MIPDIPVFTTTEDEIKFKNKTYRITFLNGGSGGITTPQNIRRSVTVEPNVDYRLDGYIDGLDSVAQACFLILSTERFQYIIYSWDYGVELVDLFGKQMPYVMSELPRRITDALKADNRVKEVKDFTFKTTGKQLATKFTIVSDLGELSAEVEVNLQ